MDAGPGSDTGRPLGFAETNSHIFVTTETAGIYWHAGIIQTSQLIQDVDARKACKVLIRKQAALGMRIVSSGQSENRTQSFHFKPMVHREKIDFTSKVIKTKRDWPAVVREEYANLIFDTENGPLWRFILCRVETCEKRNGMDNEYVIVLQLHHAITDGKSAFDMLYKQFLPILSAVTNGGDAENIIQFVPQTKSVEELFLSPAQIAYPVPWYIKLGLNLYRWKNRLFPPASKPVFRFPDDALISEEEIAREPECVPRVFGEEICSSVIRSAKVHGVTVHCVLLTAGVVAFSRTAKSAGINIPATFKQAWPIDLRKFLDFETPQPLGDIHAIGMTNHKRMLDCSMEDFWLACTDASAGVKSESSKQRCTKWLGIVKYFNDASHTARLITILREMGMSFFISISNLGNTSGGPEPNWTEGPQKIKLVEHFFGVSGIARLGLDSLTQFVVTFDNKLMWNVVHDLRCFSRKFVETYLDNLEDVMKIYCIQQE